MSAKYIIAKMAPAEMDHWRRHVGYIMAATFSEITWGFLFVCLSLGCLDGI
jgi:hypothetical protein